MKILIVGAGYVGVVSAVCFASKGHQVVCYDTNEEKISLINDGIAPINEPHLDELLRLTRENGNLSATTNIKIGIQDADMSIISVGTPLSFGEIDLSYIRNASKELAKYIKFASEFHVVCVKSTVVPGTTADVVAPILEQYSGRIIGESMGLAMNPEFLAEGTAVTDLLEPDRVIIGSSDPATEKLMRELYKPFEPVEILTTTLNCAEMTKYTANALLATLISFSNEIANLSADMPDVDVIDVFRGVHLDRRLSPKVGQDRITPGILSFLHPGTGYGGSCFPKDTKALLAFGNSKYHDMSILRSVIETNNAQPNVTIELIKQKLDKISGKTVGILGLSFKPNTDDIRETPAKKIIEWLLENDARVIAHDPVAIQNMKRLISDRGLEYTEKLEHLVASVDLIVLLTSWGDYRELHNLIGESNLPVIDGRRFLDPSKFVNYSGIGKN